jgi:hypothetical protein
MYTALEVASYCVAVADDTLAAALLRSLPPPLLQEIRRQVDAAPTVERDWERIELISIRGDPESGLSQAERVARYRAAIEALRKAL